jgi:hypothetical protein
MESFVLLLTSSSPHVFSRLIFINTAKMVFQGQDAWRRHPLFLNLYRNPAPGFKTAAVIYGVYLGGEFALKMLTAPSTNVEKPKPMEQE